MVFIMVKPAPCSLLHNGVCKRMRVMLLKAGGKTQHIVFGSAAEGYNFRHTGSRKGQRTCFIENNDIRLCNRLQKATALYRNIVFCAFAHR